jgi:hypothetical protein
MFCFGIINNCPDQAGTLKIYFRNNHFSTLSSAKRLELKRSYLSFKFINHIPHGALFRQSNVMNYHLLIVAIRLEERNEDDQLNKA